MISCHCSNVLFRITAPLLCLLFSVSLLPAKLPLRVYIMAGQSNMVGTGAISTFDHIGDDTKTAPLLKQMRGDDGKPYVCKRVWISYLNGRQNQYGGEGFGRLTAGYGLRKKDKHDQPWDHIGPEYLFGITMEQAYEGPVLIIKTAWGGQSLSTHFRSPGSGPYELNDWQKEDYAKRGILDSVLERQRKETGQNYRWMMDHVKKVLADIKRVCPDYDESQRYQLTGFVWFQGFNDLIDGHTYPPGLGDSRYDQYSTLLAQFIRDVRKDLNAPALPFVIGVAGQNGNFTPGTYDTRGGPERSMRLFRKAMAAPAEMPEFKGTVAAVQTAPYWDEKLGALGMKSLEINWAGQRIDKQQMEERAKLKELPADERRKRQNELNEEKKAHLEKLRTELFTKEDEAYLKRASGPGGSIHYFGTAKFHAQAGKAFAEALIRMEEQDK